MDLRSKVSAITSIPIETCTKLFNTIQIIQADDILTQLKIAGAASVNTAEGKLMVKLTDDELQYKFIPSETFNKTLIDGITMKKSPLVEKLDRRLKHALIHTYKDIVN